MTGPKPILGERRSRGLRTGFAPAIAAWLLVGLMAIPASGIPGPSHTTVGSSVGSFPHSQSVPPGTTGSGSTRGPAVPSTAPPSPTTYPAEPRGSVQADSTIELPANKVVSGTSIVRSLFGPNGIAYDPSNGLLFVAGGGSDSVAAVDPATGTVTAIGGALPLGNDTATVNSPASVAFDSANGQLFVTDPLLNEVSVYNTSGTGGAFTAAPPIVLPAGSDPQGIVAVPALNRIFVADEAADLVTVIDGATDTVIANVTSVGSPLALAYDAATQLVWVSDSGIGDVSYFSPSTFTSPGSGIYPSYNDPYLLAVDPVHDTIWVGTPTNLRIIDGVGRASSTNVTFPKGSALGGVVWDPGLGEMVVTNTADGEVLYLHTNGSVLTTAQTAGAPGEGAYLPGLAATAVLDAAGNRLLELPDTEQTVSTSYALGAAPGQSDFDPITDRIEVPDTASDRILEVPARATSPGAVPIARSVPVVGHPVAVAFDPISGLVVAATTTGEVEGVNASSGAIDVTNNLSQPAHDILFAAGQLFVDGGSNTVWALDARTLSIRETFTIGFASSEPEGMSFDTTNHLLYIALSNSNQIGKVNVSGDFSAGSFNGGTNPTDVAYDASLNTLFVTSGRTNSVEEFDLSNQSVVASVAVGHDPVALSYVAASGELFVANERDNSVDVLSAAPLSLVSMVAVGEFPESMAFANVTGDLYVSDVPDGSLSVLSAANPSGTPFVASATVSRASTDVGSPISIGISASYPAWGFSYRYTTLPAGCPSANLSTIVCHPQLAGASEPFAVSVTNLAGDATTVSGSFAVVPDPTVVSFGPTTPAITIGRVVTFQLVLAGGTAPFTYDYLELPNGCSSTNAPELNCTPQNSGEVTAVVRAVDAVEQFVQANATLLINPRPTLQLGASTLAITLGQTVTFTMTAASGTAPYSYSWSGLPTGCSGANSSSVVCTPTVTGNFTVHGTVFDASGYGIRGTTYVDVVAPSSTAAGPPLLLLVLIGVVAAIAVAGAIVAVRRRRAPPPTDAAPSAGEEPELYEADGAEIPRGEVEAVAARGPVSEPGTPPAARYYVPPEGEALPEAEELSSSGPVDERSLLKCRTCGTLNEPWITYCRKCKRPLQST